MNTQTAPKVATCLWYDDVAEQAAELYTSLIPGWLKDKFGLSWQIVPRRLAELLTPPDQSAVDRAMQAMMQMQKLDIAMLEAAFKGDSNHA